MFQGKNDLQTEADRSAQSCIVASLTAKFPYITIIGEEGISNINVPVEWIANNPAESVLKNKCPPDLLNINEKDVSN